MCHIDVRAVINGNEEHHPMQDLKYLGIGVCVGAVTLVVFLLQIQTQGWMPQVEALLQPEIRVNALQEPKQLTAHQYINTMMTWPSKPKKSNSVVAIVE
jgi:Tfp pilus assembly protein PilP